MSGNFYWKEHSEVFSFERISVGRASLVFRGNPLCVGDCFAGRQAQLSKDSVLFSSGATHRRLDIWKVFAAHFPSGVSVHTGQKFPMCRNTVFLYWKPHQRKTML